MLGLDNGVEVDQPQSAQADFVAGGTHAVGLAFSLRFQPPGIPPQHRARLTDCTTEPQWERSAS